MHLLVSLLWLVGILLALAFLPVVLGWILDPLNSWRIRRFCKARGAEQVEIQAFPGHYGVHYTKDGVKTYAKCKAGPGRIRWLNNEPT